MHEAIKSPTKVNERLSRHFTAPDSRVYPCRPVGHKRKITGFREVYHKGQEKTIKAAVK